MNESLNGAFEMVEAKIASLNEETNRGRGSSIKSHMHALGQSQAPVSISVIRTLTLLRHAP